MLKARDRDEIIAGVPLKQLNELKYEAVRGWFDALNEAVKLGCPTEDEADALAELKATRDVLEHNAGVVNDMVMSSTHSIRRWTLSRLMARDAANAPSVDDSGAKNGVPLVTTSRSAAKCATSSCASTASGPREV